MIMSKGSATIAAGKICREDPVRKVTGTGRTVTEFSINCGKLKADDEGSFFLKVSYWGESEIANLLKKDDAVIVAGRVATNDYNGKTYYNLTADVIVPSIDVVNILTMPSFHDSTTESAAPAQTASLDLEDDGNLPF